MLINILIALLFVLLPSLIVLRSTINDFLKTNKMAERGIYHWYLYTTEIALKELKAKALNENTNKSLKFWLKVLQDWALAR